jgi:hypothetical protein
LPALSIADTPLCLRITHPRNGFYINRYNFHDYLISGTAGVGRVVAIFANGVLMETVPTDTRGQFSARIDFSNQIEGPVILLAFQDGFRSAPLTGTYDVTPPRITGMGVKAESIFLTFNESNLKNALLEENYRFSPSLNFKTLGGADNIKRIDEFNYRLSMKSIPRLEVITLALSGISDAAGNMADSSPLVLNDGDGDRMADIWEAQNGLDPVTADALKDDDSDGFSNYQEYLARSHPFSALSAPIEICDSIPQDDAGIVNFARVPAETGFAILIRAAYGIDTRAPDAVRFTIDDGLLPPYVRGLNSDAVRTVMLNEDPDDRATYLWAVYDRFLEPFIPTNYLPGAVVHIQVEVRDIENNILQPHPFEFQVETRAQNSASGQNIPPTDNFYIDDPSSGDPYDAGIEIIDGPLSGAKVIYSSRELQAPAFSPSGGIEEISLTGMRAAGQPLNLWPHTVFDFPVKLFVPVAEDVDITAAGLAYHDGTQWLPAADAAGNVLAGGEGWLVPDSRINHTETDPALIEVQVYHFSAVQAVIGETEEEEEKPPDHDGSGTVAYISCFINTVAAEADVGWPVALIGVIAAGLLLGRIIQGHFFSRRRARTFHHRPKVLGSYKAGKPEGYKAGKLGGRKAIKPADRRFQKFLSLQAFWLSSFQAIVVGY